MIEWEVVEDEPLPAEPPEPRSPRRRYPWKIIGLALLAIVIVAGGVFAWRLRDAERTLREDLEQVVLREERAIRLGVREQAGTFADPAAPDHWLQWYRSTYQPTELQLPTPVVEDIKQEDGRVLVMVKYELGGQLWRNARAYRLVDDVWKRTPIPASLWQATESNPTEFFVLQMTEAEARLLPPISAAQTLTTFREAWGAAWPIESSQPVTITFSHDETLEVPRFDGQSITLRSALVAPQPRFEVHDVCSVGILQAVAQLYSGEVQASGEELYLRTVMRQAVLDELTRSGKGGCQVVTEAQAPPPSALGLPPNFAHYLVQVGGVAAAHTFLESLQGNMNLDLAARQATGHPLDVLVYGAEQYPLNPNATRFRATGGGAGSLHYGEVVERIDGETLTLRVRGADGAVSEVALVDEARFLAPSTADSCLGAGAGVIYTLETANRARQLRVLSHRIAPIETRAAPPTMRLIYQYQTPADSFIEAMTAEGERVELFRLAEPTEIVPHPTNQSLAFLTRTTCGWVLNHYLPDVRGLRQWIVPATPERIIWVEDTPGVVVQTKDAWGREYWQVYTGGTIFGDRLMLAAANQGRLIGYGSARPGFLMYFDHALHWAPDGGLTPRPGNELATLPYRFEENVEFSALSPDGRWLAYTVYPADGRSDINALNTIEMGQLYLNTIPIDEAGGETRWSTTGTPTLAMVVGDLGVTRDSGMVVHTYELPVEQEGFIGRIYRARGEVDRLRWCSINPSVTFRETNEFGTRTMLWNGNSVEMLPVPEGEARLLWCP